MLAAFRNFEIAAGSTTGSNHMRAGKNCQDAIAIVQSETALVATLADGCSQGEHSEVGAWIGAHLLSQTLLERAAECRSQLFAQDITLAATKKLDDLLRLFGPHAPEIVREGFLSTFLAVLLTPETVSVLHAGDGLVVINGERLLLTSANNAPLYLGYRLECSGASEDLRASSNLALTAQLPSAAVDTLAIASDGAAPLEDIGAFICNDKVFTNPALLSRKLRALSLERQEIDWHERKIERTPAPLWDDASLILLRRRRWLQ